MHTLALPKSVFSFELGPLRHLAHSELAYLIKKQKKTTGQRGKLHARNRWATPHTPSSGPGTHGVPDATTELSTISPGIRPATGIVGAGGNGGRVPPHPPQPEFFRLVTGDPLGRIRASLSLHGFHAVM